MPLSEFSPSSILLIPALLLLIALLLFAGSRRTRGVGRFLRGVFGLGFLLFALAVGILALALRSYLHIAEDVAVSQLYQFERIGRRLVSLTSASASA